ncbi:MAG: cyclic nucleotide-binding domain-containing protein [Holophagales bacterium]|nr:MAG: cyclic nucleotide-binding domain-containing protein [Holophagales bacterium]
MNKPVFKSTAKRPPLPSYTAEYAAGASIFEAGELGTEMYIVHEGRVEILAKVQGTEKQLAVLEKGDFFGEMALLEDQPRTASARALTDVQLLQINGSTFDQMLRSNPEIAVRMMRKLSRRLRETDRQLQEALGRTGQSGELELPPAEPVVEKPSGPQRMIHDKSGIEFHFSKGSETTVGRRDPVTGIHPDIDLTPVDNQRSISRRHAKLYKRGNKFFVAEDLGTMNGTFVNGERIETGQPTEIKPGDEVRFGLVTLRFSVD